MFGASKLHSLALACILQLVLIFFKSTHATSDIEEGLNIDKETLKSQFATKNTYDYRIVEEDGLPWIKENIPEDLKPVLLDATLRHGTRFPSTKRVDIWKEVVPRFIRCIATSENKEFSEAFKKSVLNWTNQFPEHLTYLLSSLGWKEHTKLGFKYYSMMPDLWSEILPKEETLGNDNLLVLSSSKVRCLASANAFLNAMQFIFRNSHEDSNHPDVKYAEEKVLQKSNQKDEENLVRYGKIQVRVDDGLLRFFDHCEKYVHTVDKNNTAEYEFENFFKTKRMKKVLHQITEIENRKEVYYIYQLCAFEMAIYGDSIWCSLFSRKDIDTLEYASDLKHYYRTGHGYAVNVAQSCVLLKHILGRLGGKSEGVPRATLRFGHAETVIPLVGLLGFYQEDNHLRCDTVHHVNGRVFRTGKFSPFSGNMAIVVYESVTNPDNQFISFIINEKIVKPFGLDCYFCDFGPESIVYKKLLKKMEGCDDACKLDPDHKMVSKDEL